LNQAASKSFMFLSLLLLLVTIAGLSCGTAAGKHLDVVEGLREDVIALVFLHFFGVEGVDVAHAILFFPFFTATPPSLIFFFSVFIVAPLFGFFASVFSLIFLVLTAPFLVRSV
jgi:hypothetical protein